MVLESAGAAEELVDLGNFATPCGERVLVYNAESAFRRGLSRLLTTWASSGTPGGSPALARVVTPRRRIFSAALMSAFASCPQLRPRNTA